MENLLGPEALLGAGIAAFLNVALRAFQQLNVVYDRRKWVMPTSMLMALCEAIIILFFVHAGFNVWLIIATGLGSGSGCLISMIIHKKLRLSGQGGKAGST